MESKLVGGPISTDKLMTGLLKAGKMMKKVDKYTPTQDKLLEFSRMQESYAGTPHDEEYLDPERIKNTKMPESIKKAMMNTPIQKSGLNETINMNFDRVKEQLNETRQISSLPQSVSNEGLATMIENIIRKVLDEKLTQILTLTEQTSINENLIIKVGESIFKGKISTISKSKNK